MEREILEVDVEVVDLDVVVDEVAEDAEADEAVEDVVVDEAVEDVDTIQGTTAARVEILTEEMTNHVQGRTAKLVEEEAVVVVKDLKAGVTVDGEETAQNINIAFNFRHSKDSI